MKVNYDLIKEYLKKLKLICPKCNYVYEAPHHSRNKICKGCNKTYVESYGFVNHVIIKWFDVPVVGWRNPKQHFQQHKISIMKW